MASHFFSLNRTINSGLKAICLASFCFLFFASSGSLAQEQSAAPAPTPTTVPVAQKKKSPSLTALFMSTKLALWSENIQAEESGRRMDYLAQFHGLGIGGSFQHLFAQRRWIQSYTLEYFFGSAQVAGQSGNINDDLRNQTWSGGMFTPAIIYRTSKSSEVGLGIPLLSRQAQWTLNRSTLSLGQASLFTYGFELNTGLKLSSGWVLQASLSQLDTLPTALWKLGLHFVF